MPDNISYIVIHGAGAEASAAIDIARSALSFESLWLDGVFYAPKEIGVHLRKTLDPEETPGRFFDTARTLMVANMLESCASPRSPADKSNHISFNEFSLFQSLPHLAPPWGPKARRDFAAALRRRGMTDMTALLGGGEGPEALENAMLRVEKAMSGNGGETPRTAGLKKNLDTLGLDGDTIDALLTLRGFSEIGGDLDTVSSAVFYARHLNAGRGLQYGVDFKFVFVNYHEGIAKLADSGPPGDIYMADMPIGAIPDLENDLRILNAAGFRLVRYEDHHPYNHGHLEMLQQLSASGAIGFFAMSGPLEDEPETPDAAMKCGADMVYEALVADTVADSPAMAILRRVTHGEDFASGREPLGITLTELIKGGNDKVELARALMDCRTEEDIHTLPESLGWMETLERERRIAAEISPRLLDNAYRMKIRRPEGGWAVTGGPALGDGSDMPTPPDNSSDNTTLSLLFALAPRSKPGEPKLNIGRACEFFGQLDAPPDYLLYCYGSRLMVSRRLNQADTSINLSWLMKKIGTGNDGGHAGAAVCRPEDNPNFPTGILKKIDGTNFGAFCRFEGGRICAELGCGHPAFTNLSRQRQPEGIAKGARRLLILLVIAIVIGWLVRWLAPAYQNNGIAEANRAFFPWIETEPDAGGNE